MKTLNRRRNVMILRMFTAACIFFPAAWPGGIPEAQQICDFSFTTCPESFNNETLYVSENTVALSADVHVCKPTNIVEGIVDSTNPPSIMFVIDHSYSMMGLGNTYPGQDTYGSRFNVVRDLLDTISNAYPNAEVGVVVFREVLFFDHTNNSIFQQLSPQFGDQSYLPLIRLDSELAGGKTGLQTIKEILATDTIVGYNRRHDVEVECVDLVYQPNFPTIGNTNINIAFEAVKLAFQSAQNPPANQYVVFLSDGEPHNPPDGPDQHAGYEPDYFSQGIMMPTTFTVYFTQEAQAPLSLQTMTEKIQENGYSTSNPSSGLWTLQADYSTLMELLMNYFVRTQLIVTRSYPTSMTINSSTSTSYNDTNFEFGSRFPLEADLTHFTFDITYTLTTLNTGESRDTTLHIDFYVKRVSDGTVTQDGIAIECWDKPFLALYHDGRPVTAINETMDTLEVRLITGAGQYETVNVLVTHTEGALRDSETYDLSSAGTYWSGFFVQEINETPVVGDSTLQHQPFDSIVILYRNPEIPLDTSRLSVPFAVTQSIIINSVAYHDRNADGFVDSISLNMQGTVNTADIAEMLALLDLSRLRTLTVITDSVSATTGGMGIIVRETGSAQPITSTAGDSVSVRQGMLSHGGWVRPGSVPVQDKMAPVIVSASVTTYENALLADTLTVTFSEAVTKIDSDEPFLFINRENGKTYRVLVSSAEGTLNANTWVVPIRWIDESVENIHTGDTIWINTAAFVQDIARNGQTNEANRRVPVTVTVKRDPYQLIWQTFNPALHGGKSAAIPSFILALPEIKSERGTSSASGSDILSDILIAIEPTNPERLGSNFSLEGRVSIFDIVNNPVILDRPMAYDNTPGRPQRLYYVWNGRNLNGRAVASGTYVAVISTRDDQGVKNTQKVRLGLKR